MFDINSVKEAGTIKQSERQTLFLTEGPDGKRYLKRVIKSDKREIYKTLEKINHENIPKIYYIGFDSDTIVIEEYIEGISLSDYMVQEKKLSKKQIFSISDQLLSALDKLHECDIIHKDVKPDNILVDESNHIWLTDYDIARIYRKEVRQDTETIGTFGYAPIEQFGMMPTDFKTDIYAFGVTVNTLLEYASIKGFLYKISEKCRKLDPLQRYKDVKAVKRALLFNRFKYPLMFFSVAVLAVILFLGNITLKNEQSALFPETVEESTEEAFETTFHGFIEGENESEYQNFEYYSNVCIFNMQSPWEHLIFVDDMTKSGKLKLGKNETVIDAEITLHDGQISLALSDRKGHSFNQRFQFDGQYEYPKNYTDELRKNADLICFDFNGDGGTELLIGLNEGVIGTAGNQFCSNVNYCIAWCVKYDEQTGFSLCEGEMFAKGNSFWINETIRKLNVPWEDIGEVTGYRMEDNKIIEN